MSVRSPLRERHPDEDERPRERPVRSGLRHRHFKVYATPCHGNDDLTIEHKLLHSNRLQSCDDFGKTSRQRLTSFGLKINLMPIAKRQAAEAVPFRLEPPIFATGNLVHQLGFHGGEIERNGKNPSTSDRNKNRVACHGSDACCCVEAKDGIVLTTPRDQ